MPILTQTSFAKGEISPELYGRVGSDLYGQAVAKAKNAIVRNTGHIEGRPGSRYIGNCGQHTAAPRLIPFQFKTTDTYMIEMGNLYLRFIRDGGYVLEADKTISGATAASPVVITATSHGYSDGDDVYISGVVGMTELNGRWFTVANKTTHTFELTSQVDGTDIDGSAYTAYSSAGVSAKVYEVTTTFAQADINEFTYTQSADVMTFCHRSYPIFELTRTGHTAWTLTELVITPGITEPVGLAITVNTTGTETDYYKVTAISKETGEESLSALEGTSATITGATAANPVVITTSAAHGFVDGDEVKIDSVVGMTEINGYRFIVTNKTSTTFELYDVDGDSVDGTGYTAYDSAGIARLVYAFVTNSNTTRDNTISWAAATGAEYYAVYRKIHGIYGYIGETKELTFDDENYAPNTSITIPDFRDPFDDSTKYPQAVGYYEQRRVFGGSSLAPDTAVYSQTGNQKNFNVSRPVQADDAITATLASLEVNSIRHFVPLNNLIVMTSGAEWLVASGRDQPFGPGTISQKKQSLWGSSYLTPIVHNNTVIFNTHDQASLRTLGYSFQQDGYTGSDLTPLIHHLTRGYKIVAMAHQRNPESRILCVRNDGKILALTFDQEQELLAWSWWETDGEYESIAVLPLGAASDHTSLHDHQHTEDSVYVVVKRRIDGKTVRYVETITQTAFFDVRECFFVDSGLSLDDPYPITDITFGTETTITTTGHGLVVGDYVYISDIHWDPDVDAVFTETDPAQLNNKLYKVSSAGAENLLLYSAQFEMIPWYFSGIDFVTANDATDPLGTVLADRVVSFGDYGDYLYQDYTPGGVIPQEPFTFSCYVRAQPGSDNIRLTVQESGGATASRTVADGTPVATDGSISRYEMTITPNAADRTTLQCRIQSWTFPTTVMDVDVWGAQLEQGSSATTYVPTTTTTASSDSPVTLTLIDDSSIDSSAYNAYVSGGMLRKAETTISGLWHLEGEEVVALVDGNVESSNTVANGSITLSNRGTQVHVGKRFIVDIETLPPVFPREDITGASYTTPEVTLRFADSRGLLAGPDADNLTELKQRQFEAYNEPTALQNGVATLSIQSDWRETGGVLCRQIYPLPIKILSITTSIEVGDVN